jgi:hypothetical protein
VPSASTYEQSVLPVRQAGGSFAAPLPQYAAAGHSGQGQGAHWQSGSREIEAADLQALTRCMKSLQSPSRGTAKPKGNPGEV